MDVVSTIPHFLLNTVNMCSLIIFLNQQFLLLLLACYYQVDICRQTFCSIDYYLACVIPDEGFSVVTTRYYYFLVLRTTCQRYIRH